VNAAFFLLTSACLTGADPPSTLSPPPGSPAPTSAAPGAPAPTATHVAPAPVHSTGSCGSCRTCDSCCEHAGLFDRIRARWSRSHDCDSCNSCAPATSCCDPCARPCLFGSSRSHGCCNSCDGCDSPGLLARFRARWSRGCGCEPTCGCCAPHSGTIVKPEQVPAPKDLPKVTDPKKLPDGSKETALPIAPPLTPSASRTIEQPTKSPF